jgi:YNFM family putative membrane transporter
MSGRIIAALLTDWGSWRIALLTLGTIGLIAALVFWRSLPHSSHFRPRAASMSRILRDARTIAADPGLPWLFATALLAMGAFIGAYNYLGFRLLDAPFALGQSAIGAVFLLYVVGSWASAFAGRLTDRHGRRRILWIMVAIMLAGLALTLSQRLPVVIGGVGIFTFGFFATHSIASAWVARRAQERRGLATAIYLSCYYLGASLIGSLSGIAWSLGHWNGLAAGLGLCLLALLASALRLRTLPADPH